MNATLGALNCEYRVVGETAAPGSLELEHDLRDHFVPAFADGITLALGGDPTVYVIRRVDCELTLRGDDRGLPDVTRRMAGAVTNAVLRTLGEAEKNGGSASTIGEDVVAFADEAEFVAQLIIDLLKDRAHSCWYYASFGEALALPRPEALASALSGSGSVRIRALGRIYARGYLERLLRELPASACAALVKMEAETSDRDLRPVLSAALVLVGELVRPDADRERLFLDYTATSPPGPDWLDRRSLADCVLDALRFLVRTCRIRLDEAMAGARIRAAAAALEWLDTAALLAGIERLLANATATTPPSVRPEERAAVRRAPARLTTRQRSILRDLGAACRSGSPALEVRRGDCAENRLRLYAALTSRAEHWADDPVAGELLGSVLRELAQGEGERPLLAELAALGVDMPGLVRDTMTNTGTGVMPPAAPARPGPRSAATDFGTYSDVAGVALLIRAALDVRVSALASAAGFLSDRDALAAALTALVGAGSPEPDPALNLILEEPQSDLAAPLSVLTAPGGDLARRVFEGKLLRALGARGMLSGAPRAVVRRAEGKTVMIGGIDRPSLWPLTQVVHDPHEVEPTLVRWREQWSQAVAGPARSFPWVGDDDRPDLALARVLDQVRPISPGALTVAATGLVLVRVWGRWLPGLGHSSLHYLLEQFIHRPGTVHRDGDHVWVTLDRRELDTVLGLSGLLDPIDARRSLGVVIHFELTTP